MRKITVFCLIPILLLSMLSGVYALESRPADAACGSSTEAGDDCFTLQAVADPTNSIGFGIDVSCHQGRINWALVAGHVDFVILRCGYGSNYLSQDDDCFLYNAKACELYGIPYGVYLYSYAETEAQAVSEAEHCIRLLKGLSPSLPVYLDLEDEKTVATLSNDKILMNARLFCAAISNAGYKPGVYASYDWWTTRLTSSTYGTWSRWLAHWDVRKSNYKKGYSLWQYSSHGTIPGINGEVDLNYMFPTLTMVSGANAASYQHHCAGLAFTDMPALGNWAHAGIDYCLEKGWMKGISDTEFDPNGCMTRAQAVTTLYRMAGSPKMSYQGTFADVPKGTWYTKAVEWAASKGYVKGVSSTCFNPNDVLTRQQLMTILYRMAGSPKVSGSLSDFSDANQVSSSAKKAMIWGVSNELIQGITTGNTTTLCPTDTVTRAQAASILMRYDLL